jgi:hypothetical protein
MSFAISKYIYPIESEMVLSANLDFKLDNPRNDKEIKLVKEFIINSLQESDADSNSKVLPLMTRVAFSLGDLKEKIEAVDKDSYAFKYYIDNYTKPIIDILSETWIIIRFQDDEEFNKITENREELYKLIFSKKETGYSQKFKDLSGFCHLVSLLANNVSKYYGESFLLSQNPYDIFSTSRNQNVRKVVETFRGYSSLMRYDNRATHWLFWLDGYQDIIRESKKIDTQIIEDIIIEKGKKKRPSQQQSPKQKLLHIGNILKTSYEHLKDPELMLLLQVSIIEYLITRNPDTNKFNVEDSISKQFALKCAILIHNQDRDYDLVQLNNELKNIYDKRSDLAHGNYRDNFDLEKIIESVYLLYKFNNRILNEYLEDRKLVEYLKDN